MSFKELHLLRFDKQLLACYVEANAAHSDCPIICVSSADCKVEV